VTLLAYIYLHLLAGTVCFLTVLVLHVTAERRNR
jgi:hypothetical protein